MCGLLLERFVYVRLFRGEPGRAAGDPPPFEPLFPSLRKTLGCAIWRSFFEKSKMTQRMKGWPLTFKIVRAAEEWGKNKQAEGTV
jgi:hypothetical protein